MKKLFVIIAAVFLAACTTQIDTGNVGVESTLGQVRSETMQPGVYFTLFKRVTEVSAKELVVQLNDMKPQTRDKITLADMDLDVYVQIDPSKAPAIMTRWPGDAVALKGEDGVRIGFNYVTRQAREAVYDAVTKYGSDVVHTKRAEIAAEVLKSLQANLDSEAGKGWFFVRSINVRNLVTDPALESAIKEAAQRDYQIAAKKKEVQLAEAEAERKRAEARGEADAISLRAAALTRQGGDDYVRLKAIEKWDGKLPTTQAGGAVPFINLK
jgi:regulator of protease activity HflC (stomatin/prohibitin superfamily)